MIYQSYQLVDDLLSPGRAAFQAALPVLEHLERFGMDLLPMRYWGAACDVLSRIGLTNHRPSFGIAALKVGREEVAVHEETVHVTPFCTLLRFKKDISQEQPKVLLVAPMSGHFATLLRGTLKTLLRDHDVYITDWHNAREVGLVHGRFGLEDYTAHLIQFLEIMGAGAHLVAVCQPTVPALCAVAVMAEDGHPAQPRSMTLMAGPIDTRVNPTEVNRLATSKSIDWFERHMISTVPMRFKGAMRRVYPGFVQISAFMQMNLERHIGAFRDMFNHVVGGERERAEAIRVFYAEYFAAADLPAEFYLETVKAIFQEALLPQGKLTFRGRTIDPSAIRKTALFTIEGEKDDICAVGQTLAAQELCPGIRPYLKRHHVQTGAGHYGVFNGRRWDLEIYPQVRDFIYMTQ